eukprot:1518374-Prymnesium_polylepis.2
MGTSRTHIHHLPRRRCSAAQHRAAAAPSRYLARRSSPGRRGHARHPLGAHAPRPGASRACAADGRSQGALKRKRRPGNLLASRLMPSVAKIFQQIVVLSGAIWLSHTIPYYL